MTLAIYAAVIVYTQSQKAYVYVSAAHSESEALSVAIAATGRGPHVDTSASYARLWPAGAPCPRTDRILAKGLPYAYRLAAPSYVDACLAALDHDASPRENVPMHEHRARRGIPTRL